jgi:hypothetical protein
MQKAEEIYAVKLLNKQFKYSFTSGKTNIKVWATDKDIKTPFFLTGASTEGFKDWGFGF